MCVGCSWVEGFKEEGAHLAGLWLKEETGRMTDTITDDLQAAVKVVSWMLALMI